MNKHVFVLNHIQGLRGGQVSCWRNDMCDTSWRSVHVEYLAPSWPRPRDTNPTREIELPNRLELVDSKPKAAPIKGTRCFPGSKPFQTRGDEFAAAMFYRFGEHAYYASRLISMGCAGSNDLYSSAIERARLLNKLSLTAEDKKALFLGGFQLATLDRCGLIDLFQTFASDPAVGNPAVGNPTFVPLVSSTPTKKPPMSLNCSQQEAQAHANDQAFQDVYVRREHDVTD